MFSQTGTIKGFVKNELNEPLTNVLVTYGDTPHEQTKTSTNGYFQLTIPAYVKVKVKFVLATYDPFYKLFTIPKNKSINTQIILKKYNPNTNILEDVIIKDPKNSQEGIVKLKVEKFKRIPGANAGIENLLMTQPGVNNSNELSTQYNVRGGSFDENLVFVNGIEVYRPFLIRSGQQEGLSFLNSDMTENVTFSAGGFEAKYGDKLSSVLNINYKKPKAELSTVNLNLLGASYTYENLFLNKKLSTLIGARYRNNQLLVNTQDTETNFKPIFADIQSYFTYQINPKKSIEFLGNIAINQYNFTPISRITKFGGLFKPRELVVVYDGNEQDDFNTFFGALSYKYRPNKNNSFDCNASIFQTLEQEYYDIDGAYSIAEIDITTGNTLFTSGVGSQLSHARNDLDALIKNVEFIYNTKINDHVLETGIKFQNEDIRDRINEWIAIDDNGITLRDPDVAVDNTEPENPYTAPIDLYYSVKNSNHVAINRVSSYFQWNKKWNLQNHLLWHHLGVRGQAWQINGISNTKIQHYISPRFRLSLKPDWNKTDMVFRLAGGWYHQPPSYKEYKNFEGIINPNLKAQEAIHVNFANEYSFLQWKRPFKMTSELYYKQLNHLNSYTLDNVRVRYSALNNATGYAAGMDVRLSGEFVPGKESWISLGLLKTEENINNRGFIARPTDQRFKMAILFQDYMPSFPDFKVYLNLVVNSPLPGGSPNIASANENAAVDIYDFNTRLRPYRRADIGISYTLVDFSKKYNSGWKSKFKELDFGLEFFNVFDIQNTGSYSWIYDVDNEQYNPVPNFLTGRILNFKIGMQF